MGRKEGVKIYNMGGKKGDLEMAENWVFGNRHIEEKQCHQIVTGQKVAKSVQLCSIEYRQGAPVSVELVGVGYARTLACK